MAYLSVRPSVRLWSVDLPNADSASVLTYLHKFLTIWYGHYSSFFEPHRAASKIENFQGIPFSGGVKYRKKFATIALYLRNGNRPITTEQ